MLVGLTDGTLTYKAPSRFIAEWVRTHYQHKLVDTWNAVGYELAEIKITAEAIKPR